MNAHPELGPVELDGFEVWDRHVQAPAGTDRKVAYVSLRLGGVVGMNKAARQMLGPCEAVKVMFDPKRQRLGIIPTVPDDRMSYWIGRADTVQLSCKKVLAHYGVEVTECRRYTDLRVVDGIMVVELDGESYVPSTAGPRGPRW